MAGQVRRGFLLIIACLTLAACAVTPARAQSAAALQGEGLFIVSFSAGPAWRTDAPMSEQAGMRAHGENMARLFAEGRIYAAGPYMTDDSAQMGDGGMIIMRGSSREEVERLLSEDPAVAGGLFVAEVTRWWPRFREEGPLPN